jgi:hypothetical protein
MSFYHMNAADIHTRLFRQYPRIANAVEQLVLIYKHILTKDNPKGVLEIEAILGKIHISENTGTHFSNSIEEEEASSQILGMLESYDRWDEVQDWFLVHDYYITRSDRIRTTFQDGVQNTTFVRKHLLGRQDFSYQKDGGKYWWLHDYITRVNMKLEEPLEKKDNMMTFESVKISLRKSFIIASGSSQKIKFRFDIIKYWVGDTLGQTEAKTIADPPITTIECEIVNVPSEDLMSEDEKVTMFAGLMLKMQDFFEFPTCYENSRKNDTIGVFKFSNDKHVF